MIFSKFKYNAFFTALDNFEIAKIKHNSSLKNFKKNDLLFSQGEDLSFLYIVESGWIKLFRTTYDGQEAIFGFTTAGDILGGANLQHHTYPFTAQAITNGKVLKIKCSKFQEMINNDQNLAAKFILTLSNAINNLELQIEQSFTMNAAQRIACFIIKLCECKTYGQVTISLPFDKIHIAPYLSMRRETFSRGLKELKQIGVRINNHSIFVAEINQLIELACVSCSLFEKTLDG